MHCTEGANLLSFRVRRSDRFISSILDKRVECLTKVKLEGGKQGSNDQIRFLVSAGLLFSLSGLWWPALSDLLYNKVDDDVPYSTY